MVACNLPIRLARLGRRCVKNVFERWEQVPLLVHPESQVFSRSSKESSVFGERIKFVVEKAAMLPEVSLLEGEKRKRYQADTTTLIFTVEIIHRLTACIWALVAKAPFNFKLVFIGEKMLQMF